MAEDNFDGRRDASLLRFDRAAVEAAASRGDAEAALRLAAALAEATRGYLPRGAGLRDTLALACRRGRVREATRLLERVKAALGPKQASRRARPVDFTRATTARSAS